MHVALVMKSFLCQEGISHTKWVGKFVGRSKVGVMEMNITFQLLNDDATTHDVSQCQGFK
jgi:hypothetical protein